MFLENTYFIFKGNFHIQNILCLTLCLLVSSADNLFKQFGPRSGSHSDGIFLKEFFENDLEKNQPTTKKKAKLPSRQRFKKKKMDPKQSIEKGLYCKERAAHFKGKTIILFFRRRLTFSCSRLGLVKMSRLRVIKTILLTSDSYGRRPTNLSLPCSVK